MYETTHFISSVNNPFDSLILYRKKSTKWYRFFFHCIFDLTGRKDQNWDSAMISSYNYTVYFRNNGMFSCIKVSIHCAFSHVFFYSGTIRISNLLGRKCGKMQIVFVFFSSWNSFSPLLPSTSLSSRCTMPLPCWHRLSITITLLLFLYSVLWEAQNAVTRFLSFSYDNLISQLSKATN